MAKNVLQFTRNQPPRKPPRQKSVQIRDLPPYVVLHKDVWYVRRTFPTKRRTPEGRIIYVNIKRRCLPETAEQAKLLSEAIEAAYRNAAQPPADEQTVAEYLKKYLTAKRTSVSRRTFEALEAYVDRYLTDSTLAAVPLSQLRTTAIQSFYAQLALTPSVTHKLHKMLSAAFTQAVKWDELPKNPCSGVILPREPHRDLKAFDAEQAKRFIAECRKTDEHIVLEFALETGMRPGEYLALRWSDVDLNKGAVHVRRALARGLKGGGFEIKEPKTKGSRRSLQISQQLCERLCVQRRRIDAMALECRRRIREPILLEHMKRKGANYQKRRSLRQIARKTLTQLEQYDLVFPSEVGLPQSINNLNRRTFKPLIQAIGLKPKQFSLYSLRHSAVSLLLSAGVDVKTIAQKVGHADITTTLNVYAHVNRSMTDNATEKIAEALYAE